VVLAPTPQNLVGGRAEVVKTTGGKAVRGDAHLVLSLSSHALSPNRFPTSTQGALIELERRFQDPEGPFADASEGNRPVLIDVGERSDVMHAAALAARFGLKGALIGAPPHLEDQAAVIKQSGLGVVVGPFEPGEDPRMLASAVELGERGVPLGFALDAPWHHPDSLRLGAAQCVRAGLSPRVARQALGAGGAALAGVADRVGKLAPGMDADLVLWSGDPLDLGSAVVAVFVDGALVHGDAAGTSGTAPAKEDR
jgi:imidazolonepropionase-like amidohydrolase